MMKSVFARCDNNIHTMKALVIEFTWFNNNEGLANYPPQVFQNVE
jgi:hypothetical protein